MQTIVTLFVSIWIAGHPAPHQLASIPQTDIAECLNAAAAALENGLEIKTPEGEEISYKFAATCHIERSPLPGKPA